MHMVLRKRLFVMYDAQLHNALALVHEGEVEKFQWTLYGLT